MKGKDSFNAENGHCGEANGHTVADLPMEFSLAASSGPSTVLIPVTQPAKSAPIKAKVDRSQFISKTQHATAPAGSKQTKFPLRSASGKYFFRSTGDPNARILADTIQGDMSKKYVIGAGVTRDSRINRHITQALLVPCINERGQAFIWAINTRGRDWYRSALEMVREAETQWIRIEADSFTQAYRVEYADDYPELAHSEPKWPLEPSDILDEALTSAAINDDNDPVLTEIVGRQRAKEAA